MIANANLISCNISSFPLKNPSLKTQNPNPTRLPLLPPKTALNIPQFLKLHNYKTTKTNFSFHKKVVLPQTCHSTLNSQNSQDDPDPVLSKDVGADGGGAKEGRDWTTSILLFVLWGALMYYVFILTPNQTPVYT